MKRFLLFSVFAFLLSSCLHDQFDEPPVGGNGELPDVNTTIVELKDLHRTGELIKILDDLVIGGVVIADDRSGNYYKTIVIQDQTGGIDVKINSTGLFADFPVGQELVIKCKDLYISDYNNLIQLGGVYDNNGTLSLGGIEEVLLNKHVFKGEAGKTPVVLTKSITEFDESDISTLVKIEGVQFTDDDAGETYADAQRQFSLNRELEDCQGNKIILRSSGYADFASDLTPTGNGSITAIYSIYQSTPQLWIRDLNDVVMENSRCNGSGGGSGGAGGGTPLESLNEDFESMSNDQDINLNGWSNIAVKGTRLWRAKVFDGNAYAQATAFNDSAPEMEAWVITPKMDLDKVTTLQFESAKAFYTHDGLSVWISTDYDGNDPGKASWLPLNCTLANNGSPDHDWIDSGVIDISAFSGTGYIGFKYTGNPASGTTSYRIDNVVIK